MWVDLDCLFKNEDTYRHEEKQSAKARFKLSDNVRSSIIRVEQSVDSSSLSATNFSRSDFGILPNLTAENIIK